MARKRNVNSSCGSIDVPFKDEHPPVVCLRAPE
jgi:hypothetical protein